MRHNVVVVEVDHIILCKSTLRRRPAVMRTTVSGHGWSLLGLLVSGGAAGEICEQLTEWLMRDRT